MNQAGSVDPEVQASISNLVSALGGLDPVQTYKLGDEALACLRDLRKWLQNYDAKYDRLEVACAIGNTTLMTSDIPSILGLWETEWRKRNDPYLDRVALACLELLVPLTWPQEIVGKEATAEHFSQSMFLRKTQWRYKRALLTHKSHGIFRATIRLAAKTALRVPHKDREPRDEGILTLLVSFIRNVLAIDPGDDEDRAATVAEFRTQKVLDLLVTLAAGMGTHLDAQFDAQDTLVMECLYLLLRGVDCHKLFGIDSPEDVMAMPNNQKLSQMLETESEMNRQAFKPTRHSRFGTMVAMNEGDGNRISISGQRGVAGSTDSTLVQLDQAKKWHKPGVRQVLDEQEKSSYMPSLAPINGDPEALAHLRWFVSEILDSSYNPLFVKVRKLIERQQSPRVATIPPLAHYCYLTGLFLECERSRATSMSRTMDYQLVGASLSKSAFAVVMNLLRRALEPGELRNTDLVHASMFSFRQILMTIRDMSYNASDEETRDAADSMKSRLFYEEVWLNMLAHLPRTAYRKSLAYAQETIAVTHTVLKMLDEYAKQHTIMFVRMKRRSTKQSSGKHGDNDDENDDEDGEERNRRESVRVTNERKFSFEKFVHKYITGATIDTYERALTQFRDLSEETVLQIFAFFRRTFAKTRNRALFYRMSIMKLLLTLVGHRGLPEKSRSRHVADQFLKYYVQKFVSTAMQMPSLHIQINEAMSPQDAFYYDHGGQDKEKYRPPKYEFALTAQAAKFSEERQLALLVAALADIGKEPFVKWTQETLTEYVNNNSKQRQALTMDKDKIKTVHNDALLRLFLRKLGMVVNTTYNQIMIPGDLDELQLVEQLQWLNKYSNEPVEFEQDKVAMDYIKIDGQPDRLDSDDEAPQTGTSPAPHVPQASPQTSQTTPPESRGTSSSQDRFAKRSRSDAFALEPSDDENEALTQSITALRKRKAISDDDDD